MDIGRITGTTRVLGASHPWDPTSDGGPAGLNYGAQQRLEAMKGPLLIALVNRLGGSLEMPIEEVDGTGGFVLILALNEPAKTFSLRVERKER